MAGIIVLSGGPIAATVAALVGAGLGGAALKELFDDYTAPRHSEDFRRRSQAGAALLWVRCEDPDRELTATRILEEAGGRHVHVHGRPPQVLPGAAAERRLARRLGKPVAEDLLRRKSALLEPRPNRHRPARRDCRDLRG